MDKLNKIVSNIKQKITLIKSRKLK